MKTAGVRCILFNQNALLDERLFTITGLEEEVEDRPYRLIVNAACAPYKRLQLAAMADVVAYIGYVQGSEYHPTVLSPTGRGGTWLNVEPLWGDRDGDSSCVSHASSTGTASTSTSTHQLERQLNYLSPRQVCAALNRAQVGGVFSEVEGACWASTEYLLCGLPVVSTFCAGGREVWYNKENSVLVEATPEAVRAGANQALAMLRSGAFSRQHIRARAVEQLQQFRAVQVQHIFEQHGERLSATAWFKQHFVHKMFLQ